MFSDNAWITKIGSVSKEQWKYSEMFKTWWTFQGVTSKIIQSMPSNLLNKTETSSMLPLPMKMGFRSRLTVYFCSVFLCILKHNTHCLQSTVYYQDTDFIDVTLACEDGKQSKAHKVVHSSSSSVVQSILKNSTHFLQSAPSRDRLPRCYSCL